MLKFSSGSFLAKLLHPQTVCVSAIQVHNYSVKKASNVLSSLCTPLLVLAICMLFWIVLGVTCTAPLAEAAAPIPSTPSVSLMLGEPVVAAGDDSAVLNSKDSLAKGKALYLIKRRWKAHVFLNSVLRKDPQNTIVKAWVELSEGDTERARNEVASLLQQNGAMQQEALILRASCEQLEGRYNSSIKTCKQLAKSGNDFFVRALVCESLLLNQSNTEAVKEAKALLANMPNSGYAHYLLSKALLATGEFEQALLEADAASKTDPDYLFYNAQKSACLRNSRPAKLKDLLAPFEKVIAAKMEKASWAELAEAVSLRSMEEPELAYSHYIQAAKLSPKEPWLQLEAAQFLLTEYGEVQRSKSLIERSINNLPNSAIPQILLSQIAFLTNDPATAASCLAKARKLAPQSVGPEICEAKYNRDIKQKTRIIQSCRTALLRDPGNADLTLAAAAYLEDAGKINEAVELLSKAISAGAPNFELLESRAIDLARLKQFAQATDDYAAALNTNPFAKNMRLNPSQGKEIYDGLAGMFDKAIAIRPLPSFYFRQYGYSIFNPAALKNQPDPRARTLSRCRNTRDFILFIGLDMFFRDQAHLDSDLAEALKLNKLDDRLWWSLAIAQAQKGLYEAGLEAVRKGMDCAGEKPSLLNFMAELNSSIGKQQEAEAQIRKSIKINPYDVGSYRSGAAVFGKSGKLNELIEMTNRVSQVCPRNDQLLGVVVCWGLHPLEKQLAAARRLVELLPKDAGALIRAFDCYMKMGDIDACSRMIKQMESTNTGRFELQLRKGRLENLKHNYAAAIPFLTECIAVGTKLPAVDMDALQERAYSYYKLKKYDECIKDIDAYIGKAQAHDSKLHRAYITRGKVNFEQKKFNLAARDFGLAIENSNFPEGDYVRRAEAYFELRKFELAKADLKHTLKRQPANEKAHMLLSKIYAMEGNKADSDKEAALALKYRD